MLRRTLVPVALTFLLCAPALAQEADEGSIVTSEEPDPTRLDVERLPPEAIEITRDLYAHGFFIEATIGARSFFGGIGELVNAGPFATIAFGVEIVEWLMVVLAAEGSMHNTNAPPPPTQTAFELVGGSAALRLQANFTEAFAIWLSGQFAVLIATTDILELYGFQDAATVGISYGGQLGLDWHFRSRHHSIGLSGGVRHFPSLQVFGSTSPTLGVNGQAYMRYVF